MLKILCVCGCGLGSSFAIEMTAKAVLKKLEIPLILNTPPFPKLGPLNQI